jgi:plasmid stabilization system protein ParE
MARGVVWNNRAAAYFTKAYERIKLDSYANAEKVRLEIVKIVDHLPANPERFPPDKFKSNNDGTVRAFEKYSFRVPYRFDDKEIRILRIRHVKQEPLMY